MPDAPRRKGVVGEDQRGNLITNALRCCTRPRAGQFLESSSEGSCVSLRARRAMVKVGRKVSEISGVGEAAPGTWFECRVCPATILPSGLV